MFWTRLVFSEDFFFCLTMDSLEKSATYLINMWKEGGVQYPFKLLKWAKASYKSVPIKATEKISMQNGHVLEKMGFEIL